MNLPNAMTVSRIAVAPVIAWLILASGWQLRLAGWVLYVGAAVTDYYDGKLARSRNLVTDMGRLLDPLADKLLLVATMIPMYWLMRHVGLYAPLPADGGWAAGATVGPIAIDADGAHWSYPFVTPFGLVGLPLWIVVAVLGRELLMTVLRRIASGRGIIISAIGPAKWKTGFQLVWAGAAFFWFFAAAAAVKYQWTGGAWRAFAMFNGIVGTVTMVGAVILTLYSLWLYLRLYGGLLVGRAPRR